MIPSELANAITSPEVLPWLTGSGGALVVLANWVMLERKDKKDIAKENRRLLDRVDQRDDTVTDLVRECTACITTISATVSAQGVTHKQIEDAVRRLEQAVDKLPCKPAHHDRCSPTH